MAVGGHDHAGTRESHPADHSRIHTRQGLEGDLALGPGGRPLITGGRAPSSKPLPTCCTTRLPDRDHLARPDAEYPPYRLADDVGEPLAHIALVILAVHRNVALTRPVRYGRRGHLWHPPPRAVRVGHGPNGGHPKATAVFPQLPGPRYHRDRYERANNASTSANDADDSANDKQPKNQIFSAHSAIPLPRTQCGLSRVRVREKPFSALLIVLRRHPPGDMERSPTVGRVTAH